MLVSSNTLVPKARRTLTPLRYTVKFSFVSSVVDGVRVITERVMAGQESKEESKRPLNALGDYPASLGYRREHYVRLPRFFQKRIHAIREAQMVAAEAEAEVERERDAEREREREREREVEQRGIAGEREEGEKGTDGQL
jgi:hypothetical protein